MNHNSSLYQAVHLSHYMPHKEGEKLRKTMLLALVGTVALGGVSALTGFDPGVALATAVYKSFTGNNRH